MSFRDDSKWENLPKDVDEEAGDLEFSRFEMYACFFWASHCEKVGGQPEEAGLGWKVDNFLFSSEGPSTPIMNRGSIAYMRWNSLLWRVFHTSRNYEGLIRQRLEAAINIEPSPFFVLCIWGFAKSALQMLNHDRANLNRRNTEGKSGLFLASENGKDQTVELLIQKGADVNQNLRHWGTSIQAAAQAGSMDAFQILLQHGLHLNIRGGCYGGIMNAALRGGNEDIVLMALDHGLKVEIFKETPKVPISHQIRRAIRPAKTNATLAPAYQNFDYGRLQEYCSLEEPKLERSSLSHVFPCGDRDLLYLLEQANVRRRSLFELIGKCSLKRSGTRLPDSTFHEGLTNSTSSFLSRPTIAQSMRYQRILNDLLDVDVVQNREV